MLRVVLAVFAVYFLWAATDFVIHGEVLGSSYAKHPELFRPMAGAAAPEATEAPATGGTEPMKTALLQLVVLAHAAVFVKIYAWLVSPKTILAGIVFGLLWGVGNGVGMGYGTYATMRVPLDMATTWCLGSIVQGVLAGLVVALIVVRRVEPPLTAYGEQSVSDA